MPTQIDGTTGVSKVQDGAVVQADLAANVAGNGPAFSAYQTTPQSISNPATTLLFQVKEFDTDTSFDLASGRFSPQVAGYYQINCGMQANITGVQQIYLYKNGALYKNGSDSDAGANQCVLSALVYLNGTTDYVSMFALSTSAGLTLASSSSTYLNGYLARAA